VLSGPVTTVLLASLREALATPRPPQPVASGIAAAVLVPLFERDDGLHLVYVTRGETAPNHPGQVAFPGGRHAPGTDASLLATALREAEEEIGVAARDVDVLGALEPVRTFTSNFLISPFVGCVPHPYAFRPNPAEVTEVFSVPLTALADPANLVEERATLGGERVPIVSYRVAGRTIWGATQRITAVVVDLLIALAARRDD